MKKAISLGVAAAMAATLLAGCGTAASSAAASSEAASTADSTTAESTAASEAAPSEAHEICRDAVLRRGAFYMRPRKSAPPQTGTGGYRIRPYGVS